MTPDDTRRSLQQRAGLIGDVFDRTKNDAKAVAIRRILSTLTTNEIKEVLKRL